MKQSNDYPILHPASSISDILRAGPRRIESARGCYVTDEHGHELLDGTAGLWCVNVGHGRKELVDTLSAAAEKLDYFHTFGGYSNAAQEELGRRLVALAPGDLSHVHYGTSGSDANDTAVKLVWYYNNLRGRPHKKRIVSRLGAYHGTSISAASLTGLTNFHKRFDLPLPQFLHTECPHYYRFASGHETPEIFVARMLDALDKMIKENGADTIAAFIGEPVMGAGGVIPPLPGYWEGVQALCAEHDILLIADEVVCGFGRTGAMFGSDTYNITPDIMTAAKSLTAGVFPMSATFISSQIWDVLRDASETFGGLAHGYTYAGHPIGAAVANTVLDIMEKENLADNAKNVGSHLLHGLTEQLGNHPNVGEIRGVGLLYAVQIVQSRSPKTFFDPALKAPGAVAEAAYARGLIVRPLPSIGALALSPPLTLNHKEADEIIARLVPAIDEGISTIDY